MEAQAALDLLRRHAEAKREEKEEAPPPEKRGGQTIYLPGAAGGASGKEEESSRDDELDLPTLCSESSSAEELGRHVLRLEEKRVERYKRFEKLFEQGRAEVYVSGVSALTGDFEKLSNEVNRAESEFRKRGLFSAADAVRALQLAEKEKLELTAARHLSHFRGEPEGDYAIRRRREVVASIESALDDLKAETFY